MKNSGRGISWYGGGGLSSLLMGTNGSQYCMGGVFIMHSGGAAPGTS